MAAIIRDVFDVLFKSDRLETEMENETSHYFALQF